jgi:hypothetical protein
VIGRRRKGFVADAPAVFRRGRRFSVAAFARAWLDAPRWLFLGALWYAPWAYGCTEPAAIDGLNVLLALVLGGWIIALACERRLPSGPPALWIIVALLLALGWTAALNARSLYDPVYSVFVLLPDSRPGLPGSVEGALSFRWMLRASALLGSAVFTADLARRRVWQLRLWQTVGLAGASIALFGLVQKVSRAPMIFWGEPNPWVSTFFATYVYHANAGAFLNLILPPVACLTLRAVGKRQQTGERGVWICALAAVLAAEAVNTSRGGQAVAGLLCLALIAWPARPLLLESWRTERVRSSVYLGIGLLGAAGVIASIGLRQPIRRWETIGAQLFSEDNGRWLAQGAGLKVLPDAGGFGFGPGAFAPVFPYYTGYLGERIRGQWEYLHEDYIQTVIEWGWVGAVLWAALFFGGIAAGLRHYARRSGRWLPRQRLMLPAMGLALGGIALHALVDFPLQIASLQFYCATFLGVCWSSGYWGDAARDGAQSV